MMEKAQNKWLLCIVGIFYMFQVCSCVSPTLLRKEKQSNDFVAEFVKGIVSSVKQVETNVSDTINIIVNQGLTHLMDLTPVCKHQAQVGLEAVRSNYHGKLTDCSIYENLEDQITLVQADLDFTIKTLVGNGLAGIVKLGQCVGSDSPIACIVEEWLPMTGKGVLQDFQVTAQSVFQILKLLFEGTEVVWTCIQGQFVFSDVSNIISQARACNKTQL